MSVTIGPYTVNRGEILPADRESVSPQKVKVDPAGGVHVAEKSYDEFFLEITLKDTLTIIENVVYFIRNGVRYRAIPFMITDGFGTQYQVRYWKGNLKWQYAGGNLVKLDLVVRVEV